MDSLNVEILFCVFLLLWFMFPSTAKAYASVMLQGAMDCETDKMISVNLKLFVNELNWFMAIYQW